MPAGAANPYVNLDLKIPKEHLEDVQKYTSTFTGEGGAPKDVDPSPFNRYVDFCFGDTGSMLGGGGGIGVPSRRSATHTPRLTGEVIVPLAVTFIGAAWVQMPPNGEPAGSSTSRSAKPSTPGMP